MFSEPEASQIKQVRVEAALPAIKRENVRAFDFLQEISGVAGQERRSRTPIAVGV
jgi:hypothetical protein